ncbi:MAG: hypothetical protein US35_C0016G0004 [Parcubacteria group bacterium GW2011_GWA2_37_10]|nr:MAG: hypothetical protein US35_C0016G0004 [Parcubacteria group bacterium GW2011_GWA2_37_10]
MKLFYKKIIISVATIFSIFFLVVILFTIYLTYKIPFNNYRLKIFQDSFNIFVDPMHPKQSNLITETAEVGNWGSGNQCQFLVGQFRLSTLLKEEIKQFYFKDSMSSGVYFIEGDEDFDNTWFEWKEKYLKNYKLKDGENVYLVWMSDDDYPPDGDIRCH